MTTRTLRALAASGLAVLGLAACGSDEPAAAPAPTTTQAVTATAATSFPVTITHALGTTTIPAAPERVVTWGWGSTDAAIALGVDPVAMPYQAYGGDAEGILPWVRDALTKAGRPIPEVLPQTTDPEIPFEAIKAANPDVILATYSGITESDYKLLSQIAPTVAYPDAPWTTPWRDVISVTGQALGRSDEATALLGSIDTVVGAAAAKRPALAGKTVAMVWDTAGTFYVYKPADARVQFLEQLGLSSAPSVSELANGSETFYYTLSTEQVGRLDSDVLVAFADTPDAAQAFLATPYAKTMPQVQRGSVAEITGTELIAAVSPPTALSLPWGIEAYADQLAAAAANAG